MGFGVSSYSGEFGVVLLFNFPFCVSYLDVGLVVNVSFLRIKLCY